MPTTPYSKILTSLDGGPAVGGGIAAAGGQVVQFSAESTVGWPAGVAPKWELFAYPPSGFPVPAGWTDSGAGTYYYLGVTPPSFTLPAASVAWGKYLPRLTIGGGLLNGEKATQMVDVTAGISVPSPGLAFEDVGYQEDSQFSATRQWIAAYQSALRKVDIATSETTFSPAFVTTTSALVEAGDSGNKLSAWNLTGTFSASSLGSGLLYWNLDVNAGSARVRLYNDVAKTHLVGHGQLANDLGGTITFSPDNASGLSGTVVAAASVGTDTDSGNILTCDLPAFLPVYTVPDGYMVEIQVVVRGVCTAGDKAGQLYQATVILHASHVGATVLCAPAGTPTNGIVTASANVADIQGFVGTPTIDASGNVTAFLDGRANNTIKWRWRATSSKSLAS